MGTCQRQPERIPCPLRGAITLLPAPLSCGLRMIREVTATPRGSLWPSLAQVPQQQLRSGGSAGAAPAERDPDRAAEGRDAGAGREGCGDAGMKG